MVSRFEITGTDKLARFLRDFPAKAEIVVGGALYEEAESIMAKSKPLVPVDTGTLRNSGHVALPEKEMGRLTVTLGYGGAASDYALIQHERTDYHHTVGRAKFLEEPVLEAQHGLESRLGARIARRLT